MIKNATLKLLQRQFYEHCVAVKFHPLFGQSVVMIELWHPLIVSNEYANITPLIFCRFEVALVGHYHGAECKRLYRVASEVSLLAYLRDNALR